MQKRSRQKKASKNGGILGQIETALDKKEEQWERKVARAKHYLEKAISALES